MIKKRTFFNSLVCGLGSGLLIPFIIFIAFWQVKYPDKNTGEFLKFFFDLKILTHLISLCVIPNLCIFFIFIWRNYLYSARGVILATFIWTAIILLVRFI